SYMPPVEFAGVFDGRFHAIKRLTVTTSDLNCGFVGKITATGIVRNLGIEAGIFTATCSKDGWRLGSIAGIVEKGLIEKCWSSSTLTISGGYESLSVGGIAGGLHSGGTIKNCYFAGIATGNKVAAGIAGWGQGSSDSSVGQIYNCFNIGQLVATTKYAIGRYSNNITEGNKSKAMFNNYYFDASYTEYDWSEGDIKASRHNLSSGYLARVLDYRSVLGEAPVWSQGALFPELRESGGVYPLSLTVVSKGSSSKTTLYLTAGDRYTVGVPESVSVSLSANGGVVNGRTFTMPAKNTALTVTVDAVNISDYSAYPNEKLYIVTDAAGFKAMGTAVNSGVTFAEKDFYMLCDVNFEYEVQTPIGKYVAENDWSKSFSGSFYGNNCKVYNLKVNDTSLNGGGLFGSCYQAYFNGLHIYNGTITCGNRAGGITGYADGCTFEYCTNGATIKSTNGSDGIGGLAGVARMSSVFNYCGNFGVITATARGAAGIAGWGQGNIQMTGCFNVGPVTATSDVAALARVKEGYTPAFKDCFYLKTACDVSVAGSATNLQRFQSGIVASYINTSSRTKTSNGVFTGTPVIPAICTENQQPAICTRLYSYAEDIQLDYQTICANLGDDLPYTNASCYYGTEGYPAPDAITSYAYPEAVPFYLSYELNGGTLAQNGADFYTRALGEGLPLTPQKEGYAFAGWYEEKDFKGQPLAVIPPETTGDKTLYAKWSQVVEIGSAADYLAFAQAVNGGNSYSDKYVKLTADIDFGGASIPALGTKSAPFCGVLDGQGHTVKNFTVTGDNAQGFVVYMKQGTVKYLLLENATVSGKTNTGSLVGINDSGLVMGCMSSGEVVSTWTTYDYSLMCQNVRYSRANDASPNSVEERIPRMQSLLKNYSPDIVGFQEFDSVWKTAIEKALTGYDKQLVYGNTPISEAGTPLYWKSSKFSALEKGTFWLSETPEVISYGWGAIHYRTCTYAVLKVKNTDMIIIAANAHLDHEVELARDKGMELIMNRMNALFEKYEAKGYNEIYFHIIGDFNAQPTSNMAKELAKTLTEARYAAVTLGTPVDTNTYSAYKETATSRGDFMFITNNVDVPFYKVALDKFNGYAVSDHYGLYGELRIGGNSHGGIAGENRGVILSCAYTGKITTGGGSGGIAAENKGRILNSYSSYSSTAEGVFANAITTKYNNGRVDFCYYQKNAGLSGAGTTVSDLQATDVPGKLNRLVSLWARKDSINNGLPFICQKHEYTYADCGNGQHTGTCSLCGATVTQSHSPVTDPAVAPTCTTAGKTEGAHCGICNAVLSKQEIVPCLGHSYMYTKIDALTHKVTCKLCDLENVASHAFADGTCICGEPEVKEPILEASLKLSHSLNLASDISVNFVVLKSVLADFDLSTVYVESVIDVYEGNEKVGTKTVRMEPVDTGYYYYFTLNGLTAVQMNNRIQSVLYGTKEGQPYYSPVDDYAIADYAYSQLNKSN
ncbi:MAG: InlB B-repeat-containing protein, partial [Oscillospiraceae bacterium]|nr:InlB B-repeat-containing protein [Oscillospiraceae bacterium]